MDNAKRKRMQERANIREEIEQNTTDQTEQAQPERVEGEVIPKGYTHGDLPNDIKEMIDNAIYDFMVYECKPPIEDMARARQVRWGACCMYIGQEVFKRYDLLLNTPEERARSGHKYNGEALEAALDIWAYYCYLYEKIPLDRQFFDFVGIPRTDYMDNGRGMLTPELIGLHSKLLTLQEHGLTSYISDGRANTAGALAILNHAHGWAQTSAVVHITTKQALTASELPQLGINQ